jgi:dTDP-4-dehydrorhamnose reductase
MGKANKGNRSRWIHPVKSVSIIGPNGQLGTDLVKVFRDAEWKVVPITHSEIMVENAESVFNSLKKSNSDWVINTAAFHKVDECEKDAQKAWEINVSGAKNVATGARELGMRSVFISSDYVYSGDKGTSYTECDSVSPINVYGHSKAEGELVTLAIDSNNLVIRIASVFGAAGSSGKGGNFVESIIRKAKHGDSLFVVDDILMSPTYTLDTSRKILQLLDGGLSGIYNASNSGTTSWYGFAKEILAQTGLDPVLKSTETDWQINPKRPKNSSLEISKVERILPHSPTWIEGLKSYLVEKGHIK